MIRCIRFRRYEKNTLKGFCDLELTRVGLILREKTEFPRTSYERATREYDEEFQRALVAEIIGAIAKTSVVTDSDLRIMALRVSETIEALITCLVSFMSMSPVFDTPSNLRQFSENLAKRVKRDVSRARAEGFGEDFIFGARGGGNA